MARPDALGVMTCPECGFEAAEIRRQKKNGDLVYRWCPDCSAQFFARSAEASSRLLAKIGGPVTGTEREIEPAAPVTVTEPAAPAIKRTPAAGLSIFGRGGA